MKKLLIAFLAVVTVVSVVASQIDWKEQVDFRRQDYEKLTKKEKASICYGKIRIVDVGEDFKVRIVDVAEDLRVRTVSIAPRKPGLWMFVGVGEDFKVRIVDVGEDFKIRFVGVGEGVSR